MRRYRRRVVKSATKSDDGRVAPIRRPEALDRFAGLWVGVVDGEVVVVAETSHALALALHDMDHRRRKRVVIQYVRPTADSYIVGVG